MSKRYISEANLRIIKSRSTLLMHEPFFGNVALKMTLDEDPRIPTFATNGEILKYNPEFAMELSHDELNGVIAHEVMHVALMHHLRRKERKPHFWQIACDHAVNLILDKAGFDLPGNPYKSEEFRDMTAEQIYEIIHAEGKNDGPGQPSDDSDGDGNGDPSNKNQQSKGDQPSDGQGKDGKDNDQPTQDPGGCGVIEDANGLDSMTDQEREYLEKEWKDSVSQAAIAQKMQGNVPAWLEEMVGAMKAPKIHYTELLRDFLEEKTKNDYSWMHPNTRYGHVTREQGIALPGMYSEDVGNIGFIIDSSGSVSKKEKERYASEISGVLEDFPNLKIDVIYVDTRVANVQHLTNDDLPVELEFEGGGGTSFKPGFEWIEENDQEPKAVIYFTDGYCSSYPEEPSYPVLWLCTSGEETMKSGYRAAPFGEVIGLEIE